MSFASQRALGSAWLTQPPVIVLSQPSSFLTCGSNTRPHPTHSHPFSTPKPEPSFQIYIHSVPSTVYPPPASSSSPSLQEDLSYSLATGLTSSLLSLSKLQPHWPSSHSSACSMGLLPQGRTALCFPSWNASFSLSVCLSVSLSHTHTLLSSRSPSSSQLKCRPPSAPATPV